MEGVVVRMREWSGRKCSNGAKRLGGGMIEIRSINAQEDCRLQICSQYIMTIMIII